MPARGTQVVVRGLNAGQHRIEHAQGLLGDLDTDPVARNDRKLHAWQPNRAWPLTLNQWADLLNIWDVVRFLV